MSTKNRPYNHDSNFDLDQYIKEKSGEETFSPYNEPETKKSERSKWIRSTMVLAGALVIALLFLNERNLGSFFGANEEPTVTVIGPSGSELESTISEEVSRALEEAELARTINEELQLQGLAERINSELEAANIAQEIDEAFRDAGLAINSNQNFAEELEALTESSVELALESALLALENFEALEGLSGLEALEALEQLENLDFSAAIDLRDFEPNSLSFDEYSREFSERNLNTFSGEDIQQLYNADVPISFLSRLRDTGLLSDLNTDQITSLYTMRDNQ
ncbi:MAG: hypothetical protein MI700_07355 [Balneolales bacterium]|nr:hypothetical protein [Balneolales bacterium]